MLKDEERKELLKKADAAWVELERVTYEVVAPRSYKEKKGRRMEFLNPWRNMKERMDSEVREHELYMEWLHLFQRYVAMTGERPVLPVLYKQIETPNGERWVRR